MQCITPGPHNLTCLYLGGSGGLKGAKKFLIASLAAVFVKAFLCGVLNIVLDRVIPVVSVWLKYIGVAYLLYLAVMMALSGWRNENTPAAIQTESSYRTGIMLQVFSPKSWIMCLSMFAVYVIPYSSSIGTVLAVCCLLFVISLAMSLLWTLSGAALRGFIDKHRKVFGVVMGLGLLYYTITTLI